MSRTARLYQYIYTCQVRHILLYCNTYRYIYTWYEHVSRSGILTQREGGDHCLPPHDSREGFLENFCSAEVELKRGIPAPDPSGSPLSHRAVSCWEAMKGIPRPSKRIRAGNFYTRYRSACTNELYPVIGPSCFHSLCPIPTVKQSAVGGRLSMTRV